MRGVDMDVFYNRTATIYNKYIDDNGDEHWYPTLLQNVRVITNSAVSASTDGSKQANSSALYIKMDNLPKEYKKPLEWSNLTDKSVSFTLNEDDFYIAADTTSEDCTIEDFFSIMKAKYDDCYKINSVGTFYLIPHWEVGGA